MMGKEVMKKADNAVCSLANADSFINQVIDLKKCINILLLLILFNSTNLCLTINPENSALPWGEEIHRSWLLWI